MAAKALRPDIEVVGVQTQRFPAMKQALAGEPVHCGLATLAEGIAVKQPGKLTRELVRELVSDITLVDEPEIERAILMLLEIEKTVAEGAAPPAWPPCSPIRSATVAARWADTVRRQHRHAGPLLGDPARSGAIRSHRASTRRHLRCAWCTVRAHQPARRTTRQRHYHRPPAHLHRSFPARHRVEATLETLGREHTRDVIEALRAEGYDPVLPANEVHPDERWADDPEAMASIMAVNDATRALLAGHQRPTL